jgi:hypothetical protein
MTNEASIILYCFLSSQHLRNGICNQRCSRCVDHSAIDLVFYCKEPSPQRCETIASTGNRNNRIARSFVLSASTASIRSRPIMLRYVAKSAVRSSRTRSVTASRAYSGYGHDLVGLTEDQAEASQASLYPLPRHANTTLVNKLAEISRR